ncbi:hypothetical protein N7481_003421 [Penicillium waksmanii]|uniref:uncharacterized protein n=1 Tax=Penicillium waksmanii TaxID=69791 RepID=UPI0025479B54|nr:uncharacterized protein N7481_003421 [Penicillium waksmanii]KAJ5988211.1 hypothetical protein N7481_003421 [Penicillium waksmanii]
MPPIDQESNILCAELIVLNYLLNEFPETPSQNRTSQYTPSNNQYRLSFSIERDLVETLSFLSKNQDGSDYIPAVCVEQDKAGDHLKVLLAINKCSWNDGDDILRSLKERFEDIFHFLRDTEYGRRGGSQEIKAKIFELIISMCLPRILCRLRLAPSKRKGMRPSIKELLRIAIDGVGCISPQKIQRSNLAVTLSEFKSLSKEVIWLINNWLKHRVQSRLASILGSIRRLNKLPNLPDLLQLIPTGASGVVQDSKFASCLLNIISKVSRYRKAAGVLYKIAKNHPVVQNMKLLLATLPQEAYNRVDNPSYFPNFQEIGPLLGLINGHLYDSSRISQYMKLSKNQKDPSETFSREIQKTLKESKIHSEIQLIAYCEIESTPELFPRAIASSKDACFLCNAFIKTHGKLHTSRTHGKLYRSWRLPNLLQMKDLQKEFNRLLLNQARQIIGARAVGLGHIYPQPQYESTLPPLSVSSTTIKDSTSHVSSQKPEPTATENPITRTRPLPLSTDSSHLSHGIVPGKVSPYIPSTSNSVVFTFGLLEIHIHTETTSNPASAPASLTYSIERITLDGRDRLPDGSLVIDPLGLTKETLFELPMNNSLYISYQDVTLKLTSFPHPSANITPEM